MQEDGFADIFRMEVPPDDLLVNDFSDEMFDMEEYLNELIPDNTDTDTSNPGTASASEQAQQRPGLFPEATVGGLDSSWNAGTSEQSFSAGPSRLSGPLITTGALPVAAEQPPAFFPEDPPQAPSAWADFPPPPEQPQLPGSTAQLHSSHQFGQPAQEQSAQRSPEAVLKQLEEMLKADNSPEVQARLLAIIAAQGKSAGMSGPQVTPSSAPAAPYNPSLTPASAGYAKSLAGSYQPQVNSLHPRQASQRCIGPSGQLQHSAPDQLRHSTSQHAAERLQSSLFPTGMDPYAWPVGSQAASSLQHSEQLQQQFMQRPPQLPQNPPNSALSQERPRKAGPQQARRDHPPVRQTGAVSLQQQAQALLPRQEEPERFDFSSYLPSSSTGFAHSLTAAQPSSLPQEVSDPWHPPTGHITHRPDLQRTSAGSSSGQNGGQNPRTSPFGNAAGSKTMTQALLEPHAFDHLPVDDAAAAFGMPFGDVPQSAPQQAALVAPVAGRLPVSQPAILSTEAPNRMVQAAPLGAAGRQQPSTVDPRLPRPTAPQRAPPPPPESRATAGRPFLMGRPAPMADAAAAAASLRAATSRAEMHPMFQTASQDSSGGSCGLAVSGAQGLQFPAITSQAAGVLPSVSPVSPDIGIQLPARQPAARLEANQQAALDHAQANANNCPQAQQTEATPGQPNDQQQGDNGGAPGDDGGAPGDDGGVELNAQGKPKRKRKRDTHQQELNKQAQHRYRERKKAKAAELAQQVQLLSTKAANLQTAKVKQAHLREHNDALRKAVEVKKAELAAAVAAAQPGNSSPPEAAPADDTLADKVSAMERKASSLAEQMHCKVFELGRHLKQSGLDNKENVPWDGGRASPAVLEVVRHLVHQIHIITHEAHRMEGPNVWDVVHRVVPPRQCAPGCHCLHCKDADAWLDVAEALKLTDEQKCKIIVSRNYTDDTLRQVYETRRALNLEAVHLMLPQSRRDMHDSKDGLKEFAEMPFFSRARTTGQMSEVVDKLKANLREEAYAKTKLDYSMFTKILSPVQSAWFITEAYPLKFDCQALASAVCQLWSHMFPPPTVLPAQPHQLQQQSAARQQLTQLLQQQQQQQQQQRQPQQQPALHQMRASSPARRMEPAQAAAVPFRRKAPPTSFEPLQPSQAGAARQLLSHPAAANLSSTPMQQQYAASQVSQMHAKQSRALQSMHYLPAAQGGQQLRPVHAWEPQRAQHAQAAQATAQIPPAQRAQQLQSIPNMAEPSVTKQPAQPTFPSLSLQEQVQELENRHKQHMLQQRMGVPPVQVLPSGPDLHGMRPSSLNPILSGQRFRGLGALQASDSVRAGAMPRPTNARLPMTVP